MSRSTGTSRHVVVAGAGILGASTAWHLASRGAAVTVIDKSLAAQASAASFGWINATHDKRPYRYHLLNRLGVLAWSDAPRALQLPVSWGGSLAWDRHPAESARHSRDTVQQRKWGSPAQVLDPAGMANLEPNVQFHGATEGGFSELDGWIDAKVATLALVAAAESAGAQFRIPCELIEPTHSRGCLSSVATSTGSINATDLVVACGANANVLDRALGFAVPQLPTAGMVAISRPLPKLISHVLCTDGIHVHQRIDGRLVMGEVEPLPCTIRVPPSDAQIKQAIQRIVSKTSVILPGITQDTVEHTTLGWRPRPADGYPAVGQSPHRSGVYAAVSHSGVTLALVLGHMITLEILQDRRLELLAPYRPERFSSNARGSA